MKTDGLGSLWDPLVPVDPPDQRSPLRGSLGKSTSCIRPQAIVSCLGPPLSARIDSQQNRLWYRREKWAN